MKVYCAWCGEYLGRKNGQGVTGVSHGICADCFEKIKKTISLKAR